MTPAMTNDAGASPVQQLASIIHSDALSTGDHSLAVEMERILCHWETDQCQS